VATAFLWVLTHFSVNTTIIYLGCAISLGCLVAAFVHVAERSNEKALAFAGGPAIVALGIIALFSLGSLL
jgi:hypothetical protein